MLNYGAVSVSSLDNAKSMQENSSVNEQSDKWLLHFNPENTKLRILDLPNIN